jgi:hypothetical protein
LRRFRYPGLAALMILSRIVEVLPYIRDNVWN